MVARKTSIATFDGNSLHGFSSDQWVDVVGSAVSPYEVRKCGTQLTLVLF